MDQAPAETPERKAFYARIDKKNMTPLWSVMCELITPEPKSGCQPALWRFDDIRAAMLEAGALITAKEAERRVLILENPGMRGQSRITTSLYAGVQLVHAARGRPRAPPLAVGAALRAGGRGRPHVRGRRAHLHAPGRLRHHALHGLARPRQPHRRADVLARRSRRAADPDARRLVRGAPRARRSSRSPSRSDIPPPATAPTCCPSTTTAAPPPRRSSTTPTRARARRWPQLAKAGNIDACHGIKMRYTNPVTGDHAMPTMGTFIQLLPKGFKTARYRSTDATIFVAMEGRGRTRIGEETFDWGPKDIFVVPSWKPVVHEADEESGAVLLLRPPRAGEDRRMARGPRQRVTPCHPGACRRDPSRHSLYSQIMDATSARGGQWSALRTGSRAQGPG